MRKEILLALEARANAALRTARCNLENYLQNPAGIGEHPDIVEEADNLISQCVEAADKLALVQTLLRDE